MKSEDAAKLKIFVLVKKQKIYPEDTVLPGIRLYLYLFQSSKHKSNDDC